MKNNSFYKASIILAFISFSMPLTAASGNGNPSRQKLLPQAANNIFKTFHTAVNEANWLEAMKHCSKSVKLKAQEYESAEEFFRNVLPTDKVAALSEFKISGRSGKVDQIIRYTCEINLKDPNYRYSLRWNLFMLKEDSNWVVDFPTKPHDTWRKHEILKMKVSNDGLRFDREKIRNGFDVCLIPLTNQFAIGKPILFRIEMKNISDGTLGYTDTSFMVNDPMLIKDSKGTVISYIGGSWQTGGAFEFVEPGQIVVLADNYDVRSQYHVTSPGRYSFQFRSTWNLKSSNIIEMEIEPRPLSALEDIIEHLLLVLPKGWKLTRRIVPADELDETNAAIAKESISIHLIGQRAGKKVENAVSLAVFLHTPAAMIPRVQPKGHLSEMEYWGPSRWGLIYGSSQNAEQLWPDYKNQIKNALGVEY